MEHIIPYMYTDNEVRTLIDDNGDPWFVAWDVCHILEFDSVSLAMEKLGDNAKWTPKLLMAGQECDAWTINESGLYALILESNKPEAKLFYRWVTLEVLPSIRKSVVHQTEQPEMEEFLSRHQLAEVAYRIKQIMIMTKAYGYKGAHGKLISNNVIYNATGVDTLELLNVKAEIQAEYEVEHQVDSRLSVHSSSSASLSDGLQSSTLADFVEACCDVSEGFIESSANLYRKFVLWHMSTFEARPVPSIRAFGLIMRKHFHKVKKGKIFYEGLRLKNGE